MLLLHLIYPLALLILFRVFFGSLSKLTFHHVFFITFLVFIYARSYEVFRDSEQLRFGFITAVYMVPFFYLLGAAFVSLMAKPRSGKIHSAGEAGLSGSDNYIFSLIPLASAVFIPLPFIYILDIGVTKLPILFAVKNPGDFLGAMELRIDSLKSNISPLLTYLYGYSRASFYLMYCNLLLAAYMFKRVGRVHFYVGFLCAVFFCISATAKAPLAYLIISLGITYFYIAEVKIVSVKVVLIAFGALLIPGMFYALLSGGEGSQTAYVLENVWRRVTWVPSHVAALYFDLFGSYFQFAGVSSNSVTAAISGEEYKSAGSLMYDYYAPKGLEGGLLNAAFFASFYGDWGWNGVVFGSLLVGGFIGCIQIFYDKYGSSYTGVCFRSVSLVAMCQIQLTNFYSLLIGKGLLLSVFVYAALLCLYSLKKRD